ncbi:MAG: HEPN domain-containing protein [Lachnospiraceae bacterium]|nr:HEPN domain-containing protein [Lachnospiraceae bacterium]
MSDNRLDYSKYRYEKAKEDLETARKNFQDGFYAAANNRAYYSVFHAIRSILILDWFDSKKHSGVISRFREAYIKTGILPDKCLMQ